MASEHHRIRQATCAAAILAATAGALVPASVAEARTLRCKSADLRYPFTPGGPKTFGVFKLKITGGTCRTAHRVAKRWMHEFEGNVSDGRVELPKHVAGFTFTTLPPNAAQTYRERGRRRATTIRFDYVVPNG
jgi:hypothetical protein